jgi:DNA (cytosine-5)-methyltransferase 1
MNHIGLFEGIGGFSLAANWMGWKTIAWCEWNEFGQKVLKYYFPEAEGHGDITKTDFTKYANKIDIVTGGFPCQPYSIAGKRLGKEDERHLWPEMLRAIREIQPSYVVGENVGGLINWDRGMVFDQVQADLEAEGYEVLPFLLPACAVNAPHRRDRVWFIAYSDGIRGRKNDRIRNGKPNELNKNGEKSNATNTGFVAHNNQRNREENRLQAGGEINVDSIKGTGINTNTESERLQGGKEYGNVEEIGKNRNEQLIGCVPPNWENFPTKYPICGGDDGVPSKLDGITISKHRVESIKAYGNAIVPQVALQIFKAIEELDKIITSE